MSLNKIVISMGDPTGIGPEVIVKSAKLVQKLDIIIVGDPTVLRKAAQLWAPNLQIAVIESLQTAQTQPGTLHVLEAPNANIDHGEFTWGKPKIDTDFAQVSYIHKALELVSSGAAGAIVTAPVSKGSLKRAGCPFPGHTELLASHTNTPNPVMMLAGPSLRVVPLTIHIPLSEVPRAITQPLISHTVRTTHLSLQKYFAIEAPRIGVAGLNPHAGDGGLFGTEDTEVIAPACLAAQNAGLDVQGPISGDAIFNQAKDGKFDAVIGMYHDQALIPLKLLDFDYAVNITLGLPIIRTSVDHGTAYDIAGQGVASPTSMVAAIELANKMLQNHNRS